MPKKTNREESRSKGSKVYQGYPCKNGHDGKRLVACGQCVECYNTKLAALRERNYGHKCRHPAYELLKEAKKRAKEFNREFDLQLEDIFIPERCPISGNLLVKHTPDAPSLDRIDSSKGYTRDNIAVISWRMNVAKSNLTAEEVRKLADFMYMLS